MKERPILFSGPMVRAILEGRKTQTRRIWKPRKIWQDECEDGYSMPHFVDGDGEFHDQPCPYGQPGDRLWVRETWRVADGGTKYYEYAADRSVLREAVDEACCVKWKPSIYMKRAASRITLEVVAVRVERLQDISRGDAMAEGCPFANKADGGDPRIWYSWLWNQINGDGSWDANPWVWVVEFRKVEGGAA